MSKYDLVVFDLDGTLVDSDLALVKVALKMAEKFMIKKHVNIDDLLALNGPSLDESLPVLFPHDELEELRNEYYRLAPDSAKDITIFPDVIRMLDDLDKLNIKVALFTSRARASAEQILAKEGILDRFMMSVCGNDGFPKKPSGVGLRHIISEMGVDPNRTLFVGDNWRDILAGADAKVDVAFLRPYRRLHQEDLHAAYTINDLSELIEVVL